MCPSFCPGTPGTLKEEWRNSIPSLSLHILWVLLEDFLAAFKEACVFPLNFPSWAPAFLLPAVFLLYLSAWCLWGFLQWLSSFMPLSFTGAFQILMFDTDTCLFIFNMFTSEPFWTLWCQSPGEKKANQNKTRQILDKVRRQRADV